MSLIISPQVVSITGTANQVTASSPNGAVTLSLPQDIATTSTPQFGGLGLGVALPATTIFQLNTATATNKGMVLKTTDNDTTKNLLEIQSSTGGVIGGFSADGRLGVGVTPTSGYSQYVKKFVNDSTWTGQGIETYHRLTSTSSAYNAKGMYFQTLHQSDDATYTGAWTGTIIALQGTSGLVGTKNLTNAQCGSFYLTVAGAGTLINGYGVLIQGPLVSGGGAITNAYGLYVSSQTAAGTLNYAIYTNSGAVRFGDKVGIITAAAPTNDLSFGGNSARTIWLERHTTANTAGNTLTIQAGGATSGATNKAGGNLILAPGVSTGSGTGSVLIQASPGTAGSTSDNTVATVVTVDVGSVTLADATNIVLNATTGTKIGTATTQKLGFFNATPVVQGTAFTQTYSTAAHTLTQTTMTDPATYGAGSNGYSTAAQASAIHAEVIALKANMVVTQNVLNGLIDDLQALGLIA